MIKGTRMMMKRGAPLPYDYAVEYIESDTTGLTDRQYPFIITDYVPMLSDEIVVSMIVGGYVSGNSLFGCCSGFRNKALATYQGEFWFGNLRPSVLPAYSTISEIRIAGMKLLVNGTQVSDLTSASGEPESKFALFGFNNDNPYNSSYRSAYKLKGFSASRNGVRIVDCIPVVDFDGVVCMYEKVSGSFYYNASSYGAFNAGPRL